jgi:hypothetical protein
MANKEHTDTGQTSSDAEHKTSDGPKLRGRYKGKVRLVDRHHLDGRTHAARRFDNTVAGIASDLGGADQLTVVQRELVEAFAGAATVVRNANALMLSGQAVNLTEYGQAGSLMVRIAARLGVTRQLRDVTGDAIDGKATTWVIVDPAEDAQDASGGDTEEPDQSADPQAATGGLHDA